MILLMAGWDIRWRSSECQNSLRIPLLSRTVIVSACHGRKVMWSAAENTLIIDKVCSGDWDLGFIIIPMVPLRRWRSCNFFLYFWMRALLQLYFAWQSRGVGRAWLYRHARVSSLLAFASCSGQSFSSSPEISVLMSSVVMWLWVMGGLRVTSWTKPS